MLIWSFYLYHYHLVFMWYLFQFPNGESSSPYVFICSNPRQLIVKFPIKGKHKICKWYCIPISKKCVQPTFLSFYVAIEEHLIHAYIMFWPSSLPLLTNLKIKSSGQCFPMWCPLEERVGWIRGQFDCCCSQCFLCIILFTEKTLSSTLNRVLNLVIKYMSIKACAKCAHLL